MDALSRKVEVSFELSRAEYAAVKALARALEWSASRVVSTALDELVWVMVWDPDAPWSAPVRRCLRGPAWSAELPPWPGEDWFEAGDWPAALYASLPGPPVPDRRGKAVVNASLSRPTLAAVCGMHRARLVVSVSEVVRWAIRRLLEVAVWPYAMATVRGDLVPRAVVPG